jgi:hypothetical protein
MPTKEDALQVVLASYEDLLKQVRHFADRSSDCDIDTTSALEGVAALRRVVAEAKVTATSLPPPDSYPGNQAETSGPQLKLAGRAPTQAEWAHVRSRIIGYNDAVLSGVKEQLAELLDLEADDFDSILADRFYVEKCSCCGHWFTKSDCCLDDGHGNFECRNCHNSVAALECAPEGTPCNLCQTNTWPHAGALPQCGFSTGVFSTNNGGCLLLSKILALVDEGRRELPEGVAYQFCGGQKYATVNVNDVGTPKDEPFAVALWVTWYKDRESVDGLWLMSDSAAPRPPTEAELTAILEHYANR